MAENVKEVENIEVTEVEETKVDQDVKTEETEPEKEKVGFGTKVKNFGGKVWTGVKKVAPYAGAFVAGAGAAVGTLLVLTRPDGTEAELAIEKDDDLIPADDFIEGEAEVVETED